MMKKILLLLGFLFLVGTSKTWADVATEGEMGIRVELTNGANFPGFTFFIKYQTYHYDMGYQPGEVNEVTLGKGKFVETGDRYSSSLLYARDKQGNVFASKEPIGGSVIDHSAKVAYHLHQIKVLAVKNGEVQFQVSARKKMNDKDEVVKVIKKGDVGMNWMLISLPIACLLGLIAFFVIRRRSRLQGA